jgi:antitoxin MazE
MQVDIVPIGNSKGIRIPKALLEQCGFGESAQIVLEDNHIVLSPVVQPRQGWDAAFEAMAIKHDDELPDAPPTAFDESEWQW